ncbi:hypothetical protein K491DRAFT_401994 [Lophiostoma macrostomum CBS 122681]|uniref:AA1-like domain-containing protein n=1 Tax=Lophiostoma macrostomum CBS 122681 TaxID=1314788 RepID=A0A6A6T903_9PLEO|nr:hypothetical protein K491DRAFT_401994 [Lophiostoma macrostomum CBS 122681]
MRLSGLFAFLAAGALAVPRPHNEMLDNPSFRAVGVAFQKTDFKGKSIQLVKATDGNHCFPVSEFPWQSEAPVNIFSVQICKPEKCILFAGLNCNNDPDYNSVLVEGPVDVPYFEDADQGFRSYICGDDVVSIQTKYTIHSKDHNATTA